MRIGACRWARVEVVWLERQWAAQDERPAAVSGMLKRRGNSPGLTGWRGSRSEAERVGMGMMAKCSRDEVIRSPHQNNRELWVVGRGSSVRERVPQPVHDCHELWIGCGNLPRIWRGP